VGEAPGKSENLRGLAFIGPSGRILDYGIKRALELEGIKDIKYYITNVVQCRPTNAIGGPNREPTEEEALTCQQNLERIYLMVKPKEVIFLGAIAAKFCGKLWPGSIKLHHPAYILRKGGVASAEFRIFVRELSVIFRRIHDSSQDKRARIIYHR
jgi:DNA polymerase